MFETYLFIYTIDMRRGMSAFASGASRNKTNNVPGGPHANIITTTYQ